MSILVYYQDGLTWEQDYILNNLLSTQFTQFACLMRVVNTNELLQLTKTDINTAKHVILVFSSNLITFQQVLTVVKSIQPTIVFHLSDEFGTKPEYDTLSAFVPLVLRQHHFATYNKKKPHNLHQIPLGYMTGFPLNLSMLPMETRRYIWGFIGSIRENRQDMIHTFQNHFDAQNYFLQNGGMTVSEMAKIYSQCKFVLNGRGCVRLDCFRIYEAMLVGAIPIVVGDSNELRETFLFEGESDFPPFLCADNWKQAVNKCQQMLLPENAPTLQSMQHKNIAWLQSHFDLIKKRVALVL